MHGAHGVTRPATSVLKFYFLELPETEFHRQPANQQRERDKKNNARHDPRNVRVKAGSPNAEHQHRAKNVEKAQHKTERPAEAADDFARIGILHVRIKDTQTDRETGERKRHDRYDRAEES